MIRLDVTGALGRQIALSYGISGVPSTIVVNGKGEVVLEQKGMPSRKAVVASATAA